MYLIGLCGRSGSGKSTVCRFLKEKGVYCIDADAVCHAVYDNDENCKRELCESFGTDIMSNGKIDRTVLGKAAYMTEGGIATLNAIAHKYIIAAILKEAKSAFAKGRKFVVVDAPVLFESGLDTCCDGILAVIVDDSRLINRLQKRDGLGAEMLKKRLKAQKSNRFLIKNCTSAIVNKGNLKELRLKTYRAMLLLQLKLGVIKSSNGGKGHGFKMR